MITYRQYKILKALIKLYEEKVEEERNNQSRMQCHGAATSIAHINLGICDIKTILKDKYSDPILICELHNLGDMEMVQIDSTNKEDVLYYSILNRGKVEVLDYRINCLKNWILPILVSVVTAVITTLIVNSLQ